MKPFKLVLITLVLLFLTKTIWAQISSSTDYEFHSEVFAAKRKIKIFLPEKYQRDTTQKFIVTYLLDAQSEDFWDMAKGNIGYLVRQNQVIPMIVVGIVSENRSIEFSPKSSKLSEHLQKEIFPYIEKEYRVNSFKVLVGHSWGGAFVGNTLFSEKANMFDAYLGISPSLGAIDGRIFVHADSILQSGQAPKKIFYCSSGDLGINEYESREDILKMDAIIHQAPASDLIWIHTLFKDTDHWSCVIPSLNNGLLAISRNYFADKKIILDLMAEKGQSLKEGIKNFYESRQNIYNYVFWPNPKYWEDIADDLLEQDEQEAAKELYLLSIEQGNNGVLPCFKLLKIFEVNNDKENAMLYLHKTAVLLEAQKDTLKSSLYDTLKKEVEKTGKKFK